jgi:hypothetical protein
LPQFAGHTLSLIAAMQRVLVIEALDLAELRALRR